VQGKVARIGLICSRPHKWPTLLQAKPSRLIVHTLFFPIYLCNPCTIFTLKSSPGSLLCVHSGDLKSGKVVQALAVTFDLINLRVTSLVLLLLQDQIEWNKVFILNLSIIAPIIWSLGG